MEIGACWLYAISEFGYPPSFTDTIGYFRKMAALGFKAVELETYTEANQQETQARRGEIKETLIAEGLHLVNCVAVLPEILAADPDKRRRALARFRQAAELAAWLGSVTLQTDSYFPPLVRQGGAPYAEAIEFGVRIKARTHSGFDWREFWRIMVESYRECARIATDFGLKFCIEPRTGETLATSDAMLRLIDHADVDNLGVVLDAAHLFAAKEILPLSVEKLGDRIFYVHAADNDGRDNLHLAVGDGEIDWEGLLLALTRVGYDGYIGVDVGNVSKIDDAMTRSKARLERLVAEIRGKGHAAP